MNKPQTILRFLLLISSSLYLFSCIKEEESVPITVNFDYTIVNEDYSVPVQVTLVSNVAGADTYLWEFEGAVPATSTKENPGTLTYEKAGTYTITLTASNIDGVVEKIEKLITVDEAVQVAFTADMLINNMAPVELQLYNQTTGATSYEWTFEGGVPESSTAEQPKSIFYHQAGEYQITLAATNGKETHTSTQTIIVTDPMQLEFDYEVAFADMDLQVPVTLSFNNKSIGALRYQWTFDGAAAETTEENPQITITQPGTYTLTLNGDNDKEQKAISKILVVTENTNLYVMENVKLGINTAHRSIGSFFSTELRKVLTASEVTSENGGLIDWAYYGLSEHFTYNQFLSPDKVQQFTFDPIPNAENTKMINSLELCNCGVSLSIEEFGDMMNDNLLSAQVFVENEEGNTPFTDEQVPRIVLFETARGQKGAIKIKEFIKAGQESYILIDIKWQKKDE